MAVDRAEISRRTYAARRRELAACRAALAAGWLTGDELETAQLFVSNPNRGRSGLARMHSSAPSAQTVDEHIRSIVRLVIRPFL